MYWPFLKTKEKATRSLPDSENEHQLNATSFWPCRMVNQRVRWPLMFIYGVLTGFKG
jgi:hypothetical protein